ncbi:MAG TPA: enolase C-terminal domain-like protein [Planctomycetota bacterium]|nr:enolase C-terminal domain-like protein [Planctomycetota bacterium]
MKIAEIRTFPVSYRLREPFVIGNVVNECLHYVITRVRSDEGLVGVSEAAPAWEVTGETQESVRAVTALFTDRTLLGDSLIGRRAETLADVERVFDEMLEPPGAPQLVWRNSTAKCAMECALLDLVARSRGVSVCELFGAEKRDTVLTQVLGVSGVEETLARARAGVDAGYTVVKLKVGVRGAGGLPDFQRDVAVVNELGPELKRRNIRLVADANQGYVNAETAISVLKKMGPFLSYIEQPVVADDPFGLKRVREETDVPVMADEAAHNIRDVCLLMALEAIDFLNIKLMKSSGIVGAVRIARECEKHGVGYVVGSMIENTLGTAMNVTAYSVLGNAMGYAGLGPGVFEKRLGSGLTVEGRVLRLSERPGFGIEVTDEELEEFRTPGPP